MRKVLLILSFYIPVLIYSQSQKYYLVTGSYTNGKSEGIYSYEFNVDSGTVKLRSFAKTDNPSFVSISRDEQYLYAIKEGGMDSISAVKAFRFDKITGGISFINQQPSGSKGGCYIKVDKQNKWLFSANYMGGTLSVFPLKPDRSIDSLRQLIVHHGSSINKGRQSEAHVHTVVFSTDDKYVLCTDLGTDKITLYPFTADAYFPLDTIHAIEINSKAGNGPRHLAFSKNNKFLYTINELSGTIDLFDFKAGKTTLIQTISTDSTNNMDKGSADIHLSNDGKFLYCTNRGKYNTIAAFSVEEYTGKLKLLQVLPSGGIMPRNFTIDPSDNYVLVGHQKSDNIAVFKRDKLTGLLTNTNKDIKAGSPVCLMMGRIDEGID